MNSRLVVNGYELDLSDNIAVPLNLSITDIKEPEKRKRSFSKTLTLEGTSNNMAFFIAAYSLDVNIKESTNIQFTPNLRYDCEFFKNDLLVFRGKFKLNEVKILQGNYTFDCNLLSDAVDIFAKLKDKKLNELNWSEYDHTLTRDNVIKSWNESIKLNTVNNRNFGADSRGYQPKSYGYIYPLVDYGYNMVGNSPLNFRINQLYPFIYVKEAVKKCLDFALEDTNIEVDYETTFFNNENMKKLIYGFGGGEQIKLNENTINSLQTNTIGNSDNVVENMQLIKKTSTTYEWRYIKEIYLLSQNIIYNQTSIIQDVNKLDLNSGFLNINSYGKYKIRFQATIKIKTSATIVSSPVGNITFSYYKNSKYIRWFQIPYIISSTYKTYIIDETLNLDLDSSDIFALLFKLSAGLDSTSSSANIQYEFTSINLDLTCEDSVVTDNTLIRLNNFIPDIKCSEFLKGILNLFYAYMSDPIYNPVTNKSTITINSFINFYDSPDNYDTWTDLVDDKKDITIQSNSLVEGNIYQYTFSEEKDVLNAKYRGLVGIGYGEKQLEVDTWMNGVVKFELPFNTYVPYKIENSQLIYPVVKEQTTDSNNVAVSKPYKGKGMLCFYNGLRSGVINIYNCANDTYQIKYDFPLIHHLRFKDNPTNFYSFDPVFDLHFASRNATFDGIKGVPSENTFKVYHEKFVNEITSIDSKLVTLYLKLSYKDINELDFAKLKMIDGVLYRLNTIKDFDSDAYGTTEVELIKYLG